MEIIAFLFSLALFLLWCIQEGKRKRKQERNASPCLCIDLQERAIEDVEKRKGRQSQAEREYRFFLHRITELEEMKARAAAEEEQAREHYNKLVDLNRYGSVINERQITRAENNLYRTQRRRMTIDNQIIVAERAKNKAIEKIQDGE